MRCLCCGKEFRANATPYELSCGWHGSCIKKFFGTKKLPDIDVSDSVLEQLALDVTSKGYTVPGVQKKLSLHLSEDSEPRLTLVNYPTGYILKPQTKEYAALPEAEFLVMQMAIATKIKTVPFALLQIGSQKREFAYITRRIDRVKVGKATKMLAMEDFCQLEDRLTADKYKGSYERCAKVVEAYSERYGLDLADMYLRIVFSYAIGNSDMHLKNLSLIETECGSEQYHLSDAYDMLPVGIIMPADTEELALTLNGKKRNIKKSDFLAFADNAGLDRSQAEKMITKIVSMRDVYLELCRESYLPEAMKKTFEELICMRIENLS